MKTNRKLLAVVLAILMVLSFAPTVMAAEPIIEEQTSVQDIPAEIMQDVEIVETEAVETGEENVAEVAAGITPRNTGLDLSSGSGSYLSTDGTTKTNVNFNNTSVVDSAEGWSWDASSKTLTLFGAQITGTDNAGDKFRISYGIKFPSVNCTINLTEGTTSVVRSGNTNSSDGNAQSVAITTDDSLTIRGSGTLEANNGASTATDGMAYNFGFFVLNKLHITNGVTVIATSGESESSFSTNAIGISASYLGIDENANVTTFGGKTKFGSRGGLAGISSGIGSGEMWISGNATVTAEGSESIGGDLSYSTGIRASNIMIEGNSLVNAAGKNSEGGQAISGGLYIGNPSADAVGNIHIKDNARVNATGGTTDGISAGIIASKISSGVDSKHVIIEDNSIVTAKGGTSSVAHEVYGISGRTLQVTGGVVTAEGSTRAVSCVSKSRLQGDISVGVDMVIKTGEGFNGSGAVGDLSASDDSQTIIDDNTPPAPATKVKFLSTKGSVAVGSQIGVCNFGKSENVEFPVTTTNIIEGTYPIILQPTNSDITAGNIIIDRNRGTLVLTTTSVLPVGAHKLKIIIDGKTSNEFNLNVTEKLLPPPPPPPSVIYHKLTYKYMDGVTADKTESIVAGVKAKAPTEPMRENHIFAGWYMDSGFGKKYDFDNQIYADVTLYAKWLPKVTNLKVTHPKDYNITDRLTLTWDSAENAQSYIIHNGAGEEIAQTTETSIELKGLKTGGKYSYTVTAIVGGEAGEKSDILVTYTRPSAAVGFTYNKKTVRSVRVQWQAADGVNYYRLYRKIDGKFKHVATVKNQTEYTFTGLTPGSKNYFKIVPVIRVGGASVRGASADTKAQTP